MKTYEKFIYKPLCRDGQAMLVRCATILLLTHSLISIAQPDAQDLIIIVRPHHEDISALPPEVQRLIKMATESGHQADNVKICNILLERDDLSRPIRAYILATKGRFAPAWEAIAVYKHIAETFADVSEFAMLADLHSIGIMTNKYGAHADYKFTLAELQRHAAAILPKYSRFDPWVVTTQINIGRFLIANASQHIFFGYCAEIGQEYIKQVADTLQAVADNPALIADPEQRITLLARHRHSIDDLQSIIDRHQDGRRRPSHSRIVQQKFSALSANAIVPGDLSTPALRRAIEGDLITEELAEGWAKSALLPVLAILLSYQQQSTDLNQLKNATRILSKFPNSTLSQELFDGTYNSFDDTSNAKNRKSSERARVLAAHLNPRDFVEKLEYTRGREHEFAQAFGERALPACLAFLRANAPGQSQRNAAYFLLTVIDETAIEPVIAYLSTAHDTLTPDTMHAIADAIQALAFTNTDEALDFVQDYASLTYWESRAETIDLSQVKYEDVSPEDYLPATVRNLRGRAIAAIRSTDTQEARERLDDLRANGASDIFSRR
jgi:hypothetical protein